MACDAALKAVSKLEVPSNPESTTRSIIFAWNHKAPPDAIHRLVGPDLRTKSSLKPIPKNPAFGGEGAFDSGEWGGGLGGEGAGA